jgi:hypothetical protein
VANEEWRDVPGWEGLYQISSQGRVRRIARFRKIGDGLFAPDSYTPITVSPGFGGYKTFRMSNGKSKTALLHRVLCEAFHGPAPAKDSQVAHWDGDRQNNDLGNLRWASPLENAEDRRRHMRDALGENHSLSKLLPDDVLSIRERYRKRYGALAELAREYNVTRSLIYNIINRKTWKHI